MKFVLVDHCFPTENKQSTSAGGIVLLHANEWRRSALIFHENTSAHIQPIDGVDLTDTTKFNKMVDSGVKSILFYNNNPYPLRENVEEAAEMIQKQLNEE